MMRLRSIGAVAIVGLMYACSSQPESSWDSPSSSPSDEPDGDDDVAPQGSDGTGGVVTVSPSGTTKPGVNPSTSVSPNSSGDAVAPGEFTEQEGYTPVLNADGSEARPMGSQGLRRRLDSLG